jgi:predicted RNA binding protein YcfA (HicA-like mRNA interferase family)
MADHSRLKPHSYRKVSKALTKLGFKMVRQRGSHMIFKGFSDGKRRTIVVPKHSEIALGTLRGILFQAGITVEEFTDSLGES